MAGPWREQVMALLSAAKNHGDLAVKISSLRQAKDVLASLDPASAADIFPFIADLHSSPDSLVRRCLVEKMGKGRSRWKQRLMLFFPQHSAKFSFIAKSPRENDCFEVGFDTVRVDSPFPLKSQFNLEFPMNWPSELANKWILRIRGRLIEELGLKAMEQSLIFMPILLKVLKDHDPVVVRLSIVSGTNFFSSVLEGMALQFREFGRVEKWLEEMWGWMARFKDTVFGIATEPGPVGTKLLAFKFLETCVLFFTSEMTRSETETTDGKGGSFNISWLVHGHPVLEPANLSLEANKIVDFLMDSLQSANALRGSLVITAIN